MLIKNKSGKIISVGALNVLPEQTDILPSEFENNPVLQTLASQNKVELVPELASAENITEIGKMKKAELVKLLKELGLASEENDTLESLRQKAKAYYGGI